MATKEIAAPDFGSAADVTVIEVLVKPGDTVAVDTPLLTLESDKATMELPSTDAGIVKEVKVKVGDKISTGKIVLTLESESKAETKPLQEEAKKVEKTPIKPADVAKKSPEKIAEQTPEADEDAHAGPGVRRLARELGVDLAAIQGSGPKNRILTEDVHRYVKTKLSQTSNSDALSFPSMPAIDFSQFGEVESKPLSRIKKISGKNLQRNWMMIPHVTQFGEADITALEEFRRAHKESMEKKGVRLTPLVFVMKAVVAALKAYPSFNSSLDVTSENLIFKKYFHLGVAVDTPEGLVVPVIRNVDQKGFIELAKELATISEKARNKQLLPKDMQGGCFSISSLGGIGGTAFTPIINAPEVAILGVSKTAEKAVYTEGNFVPRLMLPLSLSYDHRVIDGAEGARFISYLGNILSDIRNLLL